MTEATFAHGPANLGRLYGMDFISEYARLEALRSGRLNKNFSVVLCEMTGLDKDGVRRAGSVLSSSLRDYDLTCLLGSNRIAALLPDTDYFGSLGVIRKAGRTLARDESIYPDDIIFSQATFPNDGGDLAALLSSAEATLERKKASLWEKRGFKNRVFWEIVGDLMSTRHASCDIASFETGPNEPLNEFLIDRVNELLAVESVRSPGSRGILYFAVRNVSRELPFVKALNASTKSRTKIFVASDNMTDSVLLPNATRLIIEDPRLREVFFTLYFSETSSYALIGKEGWGGVFSCVHTSDPFMVEGLIGKFQNDNSLQEQLG